MGQAVSETCSVAAVCSPSGEFDVQTSSSPSGSVGPLTSTRQDLGVFPDVIPAEQSLAAHRKPRTKDAHTLRFLSEIIRKNRLCALLENQDVDSLASAMQYHVFDVGDLILKEGAVGAHFFISDTDGLEVTLRGGVVGCIPRGQAFGELALLQKCPRSVSVFARRPGVGVWAADGNLFRRAVHKSFMLRVAGVRAFLETVPILEGLSSWELDCVCDASAIEDFEVGECPARICKQSQHFYIVRSGRLRVRAGGKEENQMLTRGSCLCERAVLFGEPFSITAEAAERCELLRVSIPHLRQSLGPAWNAVRLQHSFLRSTLERAAPSSWSASKISRVLEALELQQHSVDEKITTPHKFCVVLDGDLRVGSGNLTKVLRRGQWYGNLSEKSMSPTSPTAALNNGDCQEPEAMAAGSLGCRLAVLGTSFSSGGSCSSRDGDDERAQARMFRILSKVSLFSHLPPVQLSTLLASVTKRRCWMGERVSTLTDRGQELFVVVEGEAVGRVDDYVARKLPRFGHFGERNMLFEGSQALSVEITSAEGAELWSFPKDVFESTVLAPSPSLAEELRYRDLLQDPGVSMNDFEVHGELGSGTSGVVRLVEHRRSGFKYALKEVRKKDGQVPGYVQREIEILAENDHPFILHLVNSLETPQRIYMLTEHITGGELHAAIRSISCLLTRPQAMFYTASLLLMLEALGSRDVVYRDLKPENVMLDSQGYLKLIDFGTAKKLLRCCPRTFTMVGTFHYMAPEVMRGKGYGTEVDVWALGIILYELVCGHLPFGDDLETPVEVYKAIMDGILQFPPGPDEATKDLIKQLLTPKPQSRLGCGAPGYGEIRSAAFFNLDVWSSNGAQKQPLRSDVDFFTLLLGRELEAPIPPSQMKP